MRTFLVLVWAILASAGSAVAEAPAGTAAVGTGTAGAARHDLKYRFVAGETIRTRITHISSVQTTIKGVSEAAASHSTSTKVWKVTAVDQDGKATIDYSVENVKMRRRVGDAEEIEYDSRKDVLPPEPYKAVAKTIGVPLAEMTLDPRGTVVKRVSKLPGAGNVSGGAVTVPLPAEPVAVGHAWDEKFTMTAILEGGRSQLVSARHRYVLKSVDNGIATIGIATQILDPALPPKVEVQLVQNLVHGEARFDIAKGRIIGQRLKVDGTVVDFHGVGSLMKCVIEVQEELATETQTAAKEGQSRK